MVHLWLAGQCLTLCGQHPRLRRLSGASSGVSILQLCLTYRGQKVSLPASCTASLQCPGVADPREGKMSAMDPLVDLNHMAQQMVVSFASSSTEGCPGAERLARSMGATTLRLALLASPALLIVAEDTKRFYQVEKTLAGEALRINTAVSSVRHSLPSPLEDVEECYQNSGCCTLTAVPIITEDAAGVLLFASTVCQVITEQHMHTLGALAAAVAPALQQFMRKTVALQDTSLFLGRATAEYLYGCSFGGACASESSGAEDAEWLDFDMAPYLADDDVAPKAEGTLDLEPCESLESICSEGDALAGLRSRLLSLGA